MKFLLSENFFNRISRFHTRASQRFEPGMRYAVERCWPLADRRCNGFD